MALASTRAAPPAHVPLPPHVWIAALGAYAWKQGRKDWNPQAPEGAERIFSERKYKTKVRQRLHFAIRVGFLVSPGEGEEL